MILPIIAILVWTALIYRALHRAEKLSKTVREFDSLVKQHLPDFDPWRKTGEE